MCTRRNIMNSSFRSNFKFLGQLAAFFALATCALFATTIPAGTGTLTYTTTKTTKSE
jgi:hypothetical protein